jgi:hypothetical protein
VKKTGTLQKLFSFPGFNAQGKLKGVFGDPKARIVELRRQKKERYAQGVARVTAAITMLRSDRCATSMRWDGAFISAFKSDG